MFALLSQIRRSLSSVVLASVFLAGAHADLTVSSTMTMRGGHRSQKSLVTTYYRGNLVRMETGDRIRIVDAKTGLVTILSPKERTYRTLRLADAFAKIGRASKREMRFNAKISPRTQRKSVLGRSAQRYTGTGTLSVLSSRPGAVEQPVMKVLIDQWASPTVHVPTSSVAIGLAGMPGMGSGLASNAGVAKEMGKIKGLPLTSHFEIIPANTVGSRIVVDSQVTRIVERPLDPALFRVPSGYRKIQPRSAPETAL